MLRDDLKIRLNSAFRALRKDGLVARQAFMCCQNCAGTKIANDITVMPEEKRKAIKGTVFYTKQDAEPQREGLYLAFGPIETSAHGTIGEDTVAVGKRTVKALQDAGLTVEWDGTANKRIFVEDVG
jgi:co-chaperonin GroES (HSP10)